LYLDKTGNTLIGDNLIPFDVINDKIWSLETEIFAPCAASRLITKHQIDQMIETGLEVISCGANVPFADKEIFFGPIMEYTDNKISLIPDFISNCGMARVFAYFMEQKVQMTDDAIFSDTSNRIKQAIKQVYNKNKNKTGISETAFEIALSQLI
jgi:glutamate dehydrogenase/leucine dehydrogenase